MRVVGVYEVCGKLAFRGHPAGTVFTAGLPVELESRAVSRGNIRLLERIGMTLPEHWTLPRGWA